MNENQFSAPAGQGARQPAAAAQATSLIDRQSRFSGSYQALQNLRIEGVVNGEIDCRGMLVVAETAVVDAKVTVRDIRIAGELRGEVECGGRFELMPTARVAATVRARQVVVHEGAIYNGELEMVSEEEARQIEERRAAVAAEPAPARRREEAPRMAAPSEPGEGEDLEKLPDATEFGRRLSEVLESRPSTRRRA